MSMAGGLERWRGLRRPSTAPKPVDAEYLVDEPSPIPCRHCVPHEALRYESRLAVFWKWELLQNVRPSEPPLLSPNLVAVDQLARCGVKNVAGKTVPDEVTILVDAQARDGRKAVPRSLGDLVPMVFEAF